MKDKRWSTPYKREYWMLKFNLSEEEADLRIKQFKLQKATSLEGFIYRWGEEEGRKKYEEKRFMSIHTEEIYIKKYGQEKGLDEWNEYRAKKDTSSFEWALKKAKGDKQEARKIYDQKRKSSILNPASYSLKHNISLEEAELEIQKIYKKKAFSIENLKERYGFSDEEAVIAFKRINKRRGYSLENLERKHPNNPELVLSLYNERRKKLKQTYQGSKESLDLLLPFYQQLLELGFNAKDLHIGYNDQIEFFIREKDQNLIYFYDFTILSHKLIIEYNGEHVHPNIEKHSIEFLRANWKHAFGIDFDTVLLREQKKSNLAIRNGFQILTVWNSDSIEFNKTKICNFLKQNNINI